MQLFFLLSFRCGGGISKNREAISASSGPLSEFHAWLQQKRNQNLSFLLWVRTLISDETIVGMKWDDFVGKPRPNRAGKKLDFNALFQVFSKEKSQMSMGTMVAAQAEKEEEEGRGRSRRSR